MKKLLIQNNEASLKMEVNLLKQNLSEAMDMLYGRHHEPSIALSKVFDRKKKTVEIWVHLNAFTFGTHKWGYKIDKLVVLPRIISKQFKADMNNMGYASYKIDTVSIDGAYQYPFKKYTYSISSGSLQTSMVLLVADKSQPPLNG